ncbi:stage II sporulation protein P [Candidatus Ventrimonas sp. KK005]
MSDWMVWLVRGMTVLLGSCYPAIWPERKPEPQWGKDPSYALYENYRYTYDTYVYLFWDESTYAGPEDAGVMSPGIKWNHMGDSAKDHPESKEGQADNNPGPKEASGNGPEEESRENRTADSAGTGEMPENGDGENVQALAKLRDYDYLMKHFYSVHTSTTAPRDLMKAEELITTDLHLEKDSENPQILIYHTHSQETYKDYGPENPDATVVGAGNYLTRLLEEKGWNVIHDTSSYDLKGGKLDRSKAYNYALEGISKILKENPSIQVVLDLHRDGVKESLHLVSEVGGKPTANIMFFQGMSRTPEGEIAYLPNPFLKENLAFSLQMQLDAAQRFPGYTRKIYMKGLRYNLHLRPRSALIEVGAQTNSGQEAMNAMEPLAELLDRVLQGG